MNRCRGPKDEEPHITLFADPIGAVTEMAKTNPAIKLGMALLPTLGLDGVKAVGGSYTLATEDFDGIMQLHLSLGYPRSGALELLALDSGDDTPPNWVPGDIAGYTSIHWNFQQTFDKGMKLADSFQGPGVMAKNINDRTRRWFGLDVDHDILPALTGRVLHITWFDHPVKPGIGGHNLIALQLRDPHTFADSFQKITSHLPPQWEKKSFASIDYYQLGNPKDADDPRPTPCIAMFNDWAVVTDRTGILEHVLSNRDETENNLASALDYKLIASKIAHHGGHEPRLHVADESRVGHVGQSGLADAHDDDAFRNLEHHVHGPGVRGGYAAIRTARRRQAVFTELGDGYGASIGRARSGAFQIDLMLSLDPATIRVTAIRCCFRPARPPTDSRLSTRNIRTIS